MYIGHQGCLPISSFYLAVSKKPKTGTLLQFYSNYCKEPIKCWTVISQTYDLYHQNNVEYMIMLQRMGYC